MESTVTKLQPVIADAARSTRHVFVRDLTVQALIGIHAHEKINPQKLLISIDLTVEETDISHEDQIHNVVCYEKVVNTIKAIINSGHINLVETLAETIAARTLENKLVLAARVRIEKPDAFEDAECVGVEIERIRGINA
jgi:dihydroneopterin aldolase